MITRHPAPGVMRQLVSSILPIVTPQQEHIASNIYHPRDVHVQVKSVPMYNLNQAPNLDNSTDPMTGSELLDLWKNTNQKQALHPTTSYNIHDTISTEWNYSDRIWPGPFRSNSDDRIISQIRFVPYSVSDASHGHRSLSQKTVLVYNNQDETLVSGGGIFRECHVTYCLITKKESHLTSADAVLFLNDIPDKVPRHKTSNQIWILYSLEAPLHTKQLYDYQNLINWTATYRRDSTIVTPYEKFDPYKATEAKNSIHNYNRNHTKTRKVAWFVSNCHTSNGRMEYVRELQRYIQVDIFGDCGFLQCSKMDNEAVCYTMLKRDYYFYLAFENANCRDYITEKLFHNALR